MNSQLDNLLWLDLEMTGLDDQKDQIIEIAVILSNSELDILQEGPCLSIQCPEHLLSTMDEWCTNTHTKSGLLDKVRTSTLDSKQVE